MSYEDPELTRDHVLGVERLLRNIVTVSVTVFAAWLTHVVVCLSSDQWGFLIAGAIFFPIGIVHGIGIWLGIWPGIWY